MSYSSARNIRETFYTTTTCYLSLFSLELRSDGESFICMFNLYILLYYQLVKIDSVEKTNLKNPVLYPELRKMLSIKAQVEPFPLVPVM